MATHQKKHIKNTGPKELIFRAPNEGEEYAVVNASKGDARFEVTIISNNTVVIAKARGAIIKGPKKQRIEKSDTVLLQVDNTTSTGDKYFIIHKYSADDVKRLKKAGELAQIRETSNEDKTVVAFEGDVVASTIEDIEIDDDFIADL